MTTSEAKRRPQPSPKTFERKAGAMPTLKPARPAETKPASETAKAEADKPELTTQRELLLRVVEAVKAL